MSQTTEYTYCALGALYEAGATGSEVAQIEREVVAIINESLPLDLSYTAIPRWNDDPERTAEEVRETLLMTAKYLRNADV